MVKRIKITFSMFLMLILFSFAACFAKAFAAEYTRNAVLSGNAAYPGVYYVKAEPGDQNATIGIPSLAKQDLTAPTTESPAIIMGAAVPYETRTGTTSFMPLPGGTLYPPYSYFRYSIIREQGPDGSWHDKMSGFDGSYVIIRVDVSELIKDAPAGSYLHVKQAGNKAMMASLLYDKYGAAAGKGSFSDALGNKTAVYAIDNGAVSMKDAEGNDRSTPYVDVIVYSSGTLVAGAETGSTDPNVANADFSLSFYVDQTADYNPGLDYDPNNASATTPTHEEQVLAKFYDESKVSAADVTGYTVKGNDLEIEIVHPGPNGSAAEYWSLRKAMSWPQYNATPIKMICEVPVLEGLVVDGADGGYRHVIFDVNSFDIQIANHQETGAAALTVRNAMLTVMDGFNTTGAELAVGNNARMSIEAGGTLIIDETCQVEVEYDAASVAPGSETPAPEYDTGVITIEDGGRIINNGVISIEGTEGKPIDPAAPSARDMKAAELHINAGGVLENNGALLAYGDLYNLGTIINNGYYNDTITSNDPDKGQFSYHRGIQIAWKDDVTQEGVAIGRLMNGSAESEGASLVNNGDIVLVPGLLYNYGSLSNNAGGNIYLCAVDQAVIPTQVPWQVLIVEERIGFERPIAVFFTNHLDATLENAGNIASAYVEIVGNGRTGTLSTPVRGDLLYDIGLDSFGQLHNSGSIALDGVYVSGEMYNSGTVADKLVLEVNMGSEGSLIDTAGLTNVYNAAMTEEGNARVWTRVGCGELSVTPSVQYSMGGETVTWKVNAKTKTEGAEGVRYFLQVFHGKDEVPVETYTITANEENALTSPVLPYYNANAVYSFFLVDGDESVGAEATVKLSSSVVTPPAPVKDLIYNGRDQLLIIAGGTTDGTMMYKLGEAGEWSGQVPVGKDAGSYRVYYKLSGEGEGAENAFVDAVIAKRPVTISGNDAASQAGAELAELSWTVSGLAEGETTLGDGVVISASTDAQKDAVGTYKVTVTVEGENPNYEITARDGKYAVTNDAFAVIAKDKYGVFSDEATYRGFNIELTVPEGATAYYSTTAELTDENYLTAGMTALKNLPATAGTHTVYYYVTNGVSSVSGSKQVIIDKARQTAPDAEKLTSVPETWRNSGDGRIEGFTPRKMEFRLADNDGSYRLAYNQRVFVRPGTYLIRLAGDDNHYPSPDTEVTVAEGPSITVSFNCNGSASSIDSVTGLAYGDRIPRPRTDPALPEAVFLGWYYYGRLFDFNKTTAQVEIQQEMTLTAGWAPRSIAFILPAGLTVIEESAFEGLPMRSVEIPGGCTAIAACAFKDCALLRQIIIPASVENIDPTAFDGCGGVYVFGRRGTAAEQICTPESGLIFVADVN